MTGWDASRVIVNGSQLGLNFMGLAPVAGQSVIALQVQPGSLQVNCTTPPVITFCPPNQTATAATPAGVVVNYPAAMASGACGTPTITYSQNSGTLFPIGDTTVTVTATDPSNNQSGCTFNVHVDGIPVPAITSLSPTSVTANGPDFTLIVNGSGFIERSVVQWNGASRATTYISGSQVSAQISAADIASDTEIATATVTVNNPFTGQSNPATSTIVGSNVSAVQSSAAPPGTTATVSTAPTDGSSAGVAAAFNDGSGAQTVTGSGSSNSDRELLGFCEWRFSRQPHHPTHGRDHGDRFQPGRHLPDYGHGSFRSKLYNQVSRGYTDGDTGYADGFGG